MTRKVSKEELFKILSNNHEQMIKSISGGAFLLGLDMGIICHCQNREEGVRWVKHNFGKNTSFIDTIDLALKKENKCSKCDKENSSDAVYCCYCGEKLEKN